MSNPFYTYSGSFIPGTLARAEAEATEFSSVQAGFALLVIYGVDTGAANAYVVTTQGQPTVAYQDGNEVLFKAANTNTMAATINVNGVGVVSIFRYNGGATQAGDIIAGTYYTLIYNSTYGGFTIIGPAAIVSFSGTISASPPVHLVGLVAAGGVSSAAAPIDATWAIDQSISPTWTGAQTFGGSIGGVALTNYLAAPAAIGGVTPAAGAFTNLAASGTVSGAGFTNFVTAELAAPPAIGGTTPAAGHFTTLSASSTLSVSGTFTSKLITDNGNVSIAAPASGVALTVTGVNTSGINAMLIQGSTTAGARGLTIFAGNSSSDFALIVDNAADSVAFLYVAGDGSVVVGTPTGGAKGNGTINVSGGYYVNGALLSTASTGSFTGTLTGFTTTVTGTITYTLVGNILTLFIPDMSGTSNSTSMSLTSATFLSNINVTTAKTALVSSLRDNTNGLLVGTVTLNASPNTAVLSFFLLETNVVTNEVQSGATFTASGLKGIGATVLSFTLD